MIAGMRRMKVHYKTAHPGQGVKKKRAAKFVEAESPSKIGPYCPHCGKKL
jgi:hypothetical protein